mgnify:FL=1
MILPCLVLVLFSAHLEVEEPKFLLLVKVVHLVSQNIGRNVKDRVVLWQALKVELLSLLKELPFFFLLRWPQVLSPDFKSVKINMDGAFSFAHVDLIILIIKMENGLVRFFNLMEKLFFLNVLFCPLSL